MEVSRIFRAYQTIITMLGQRVENNQGYSCEKEMDIEEFKEFVKSSENEKYIPLLFKRNEETIHVFFTKKLGVPVILKTLTPLLKLKNKIHLFYFFDEADMNNVQKKKEQLCEKVDIELFYLTELAFPIVNHIYVKPHRKLNLEEKQEVYEYYEIKNDEDALQKIPILLQRDSVSKYYNYKKFDLIVIDEMKNPYFRIVFPSIKIAISEKESEE